MVGLKFWFVKYPEDLGFTVNHGHVNIHFVFTSRLQEKFLEKAKIFQKVPLEVVVCKKVSACACSAQYHKFFAIMFPKERGYCSA